MISRSTSWALILIAGMSMVSTTTCFPEGQTVPDTVITPDIVYCVYKDGATHVAMHDC